MHKNIKKLIVKWNFKALKYVINIKKLKTKKEEGFFYFKKIIKDINESLNLELKVYGLENISNLSDNFIIYSNHRGMYDPLAITTFIEKPLSYVMKSELEKNFFIKDVGIMTNSRFLERNPKEDLKTILEIIELQKTGNNFLIFPEGTRNKENNLKEFKAGAFKIPLKTKADIIPVTLYGTETIFDEEIKKEIKISFLKPIKYEEYKNMKTTELSTYIKNLINEEYQKLKK